MADGGDLEISYAWRTTNSGHLLNAATGVFIRDKLEVIHRGGQVKMTEPQMALIHHLDRRGNTLTELAARANLTKQSMIELVDRAEAQRLIERTPDPCDGRVKVVRFTKPGLALLDILREAVAAAEVRMADCLQQPLFDEIKAKLADYASVAPVDGEDVWRTGNAGRLMSIAARSFASDVLQVVHRRGHTQIGEGLIALFRNLDVAGSRLTVLAARARVTKQSMRELVDRAEALALVERHPDPTDSRAKLIAFTVEGLAMLGHMRSGVTESENRFEQTTGAEFVAALKAGLRLYLDR